MQCGTRSRGEQTFETHRIPVRCAYPLADRQGAHATSDNASSSGVGGPSVRGRLCRARQQHETRGGVIIDSVPNRIPEFGHVLPFIEEHRERWSQRGLGVSADDRRARCVVKSDRACGPSGGRGGLSHRFGPVDGNGAHAGQESIELAVHDSGRVRALRRGAGVGSHVGGARVRKNAIWYRICMRNGSTRQCEMVVYTHSPDTRARSWGRVTRPASASPAHPSAAPIAPRATRVTHRLVPRQTRHRAAPRARRAHRSQRRTPAGCSTPCAG